MVISTYFGSRTSLYLDFFPNRTNLVSYNYPLHLGYMTKLSKNVNWNLVVLSLTGKSFSEVLILASTNPQYDTRLSIELPVQYIKMPSSEHCQNMLCTQSVLNVKTKNNLCTEQVLSLQFSCTELSSNSIFCYIVG